jgi:5-formyltetrahydrofolate cyclo-ligase
MTMQPSKSDLRRAAAAARGALARAAGDIGARLVTSFASAVLLKPCHTVAGYYPFRDEADPLPILRFLAASGWTCALPVPVDGPEGLVFRRWRPDGEVVTGRYSIPHPPETCAEVRPDVVLVPLLAYDGQRVAEVPVQDHDERLDLVVTEQDALDFRKAAS